MKQIYIAPLLALVLFINAWADETNQKSDESPRLTVALQLSDKTYDPENPAGSLTCIVENRTTEEMRLPADYDGKQLVIYGGGKTHRSFSRLWRPNANAEARPRLITIDPGEKATVFEAPLEELLVPQNERAKEEERKWAWDWRLQMESPATPIHGWRRDGFEESASFFAELQIGKEKFESEVVVLTVKQEPDEATTETSVQRSGDAGKNSAKITLALQEMRATLNKLVELRKHQYQSGEVDIRELITAQCQLLEVDLKLAESPADRTKVLSQRLRLAKDAEKHANAKLESGAAPQTDVLEAQIARMQIEVLILQEASNED